VSSLLTFTDYFLVQKETSLVKVLLSNTLCFEAQQNYVRLPTSSKSYVFALTLKELKGF